MSLAIDLIVQMEIFAILAISFNLLLGYSGQFSMAQAAFFGVGAYTSGILAVELGINPLLCIPLAMAATALVGVVIGLSAVRVSGPFLVVATLGFQIIASGFFTNLDITGGSNGLAGIPLFQVGSLVITPDWTFVAFAAVFVALTALCAWRVVSSPVGLVLKAMRDDEVATNALGKDTKMAKLLIFVLAAMMAAVAGSLLGGFTSFISPDRFDVNASVLIFTLVVLGGTGTILGGIVGAVILVGLPQLLTFLPIPGGSGAYVEQVIYALLVLLFLILRPQGLVGHREAVSSAEANGNDEHPPAAPTPSRRAGSAERVAQAGGA